VIDHHHPGAARWLIGGDDHLFLRDAEGFFLIEAEQTG